MSRIWDALRRAERFHSRANSERRRAIRQKRAVPILVYGSDQDEQPFHEEVETIDVTDLGCLFPLETLMAPGQRLALTNIRNEAQLDCRVVHMGKRIRGKAPVGIAFHDPSPDFWRAS